MKCNKLKAYKMIDEKYCDDSFCVVPSDVYLKSEADEELAKLNRQVKFLQITHSSCNNCNKCADGMGRVFDASLYELKKEKASLLEHTTEVINSQERVIHRQKYKRCIAIVRWCFAKSNYHFHLAISGFNHEENIRKDALYTKWRHRWLNIAAQFKDAK